MATKRQEIETHRGGGQERQSAATAESSQNSARAPQRQSTRAAAPEQRQREPGGLKGISAEQLARGLGWFSIGLGLAEVLAPRAIARISGVRSSNAALIRLFGLREIASGIAIFSQGERPAAAVWSRVAGDALDLAALG